MSRKGEETITKDHEKLKVRRRERRCKDVAEKAEKVWRQKRRHPDSESSAPDFDFGDEDFSNEGGDIHEINALGADENHGYERANLLIDSGASISACPIEKATGFEKLPPEGPDHFKTANNGQVKNEGGVEIVAAFQNGDEKKIKFKVLGVKRMIAAVSKLVSNGHRVVFDSEAQGGSYIMNKRTGRTHKIFERNGVYEVPIWVKKPTPFGGQSQQWA